MLSNDPVFPTVPTTNVKKAKVFYRNKLGLKLIYEEDDGLLFEAGKKSRIYVYKRPPSSAEHTLAAFYVDNIHKTVDELTKKGVEFEKYNEGSIKTDEKGIAKKGKLKAAWFKDPDGNIIGLSQVK